VHHGPVEVPKRGLTNGFTPLFTLDNFFLIIWIDEQDVYAVIARLPDVLDPVA